MSDFSYAGSELDVFAHARNWKRYLYSHLRPYLTGDVLEVGAGIGSATEALCDGKQRRWVCLEPDRALAARIPRPNLPGNCEILTTALGDLPASEVFDCILYVDVLEHIGDDRGELELAAAHLKNSGVIAILAPAHPWLFTPFDEAIGHFRRYTRPMLRRIAPALLREETLIYLDSIGMFASVANRLLLHSAQPTVSQILFWDRVLVPVSRAIDPLLGRAVGKSVLGVWRRP